MPAEEQTVVVIEDDHNIADLVTLYLRRDGFRVLLADDAERGLEIVDREKPALVVLDLGLPGRLDGFDVCRAIRSRGEVPVVVLTARQDEVDRILGLELGADDYMTKPFSPRELVARVHAILRRSTAAKCAPIPAVLSAGAYTVDTGRREVTGPGGSVPLATREFDLLAYLAAHQGLVLSRRQLLDGAWGPDWYGDDRTVDVHVRQLRKKLGDDLPLATVRGVGYRLG